MGKFWSRINDWVNGQPEIDIDPLQATYKKYGIRDVSEHKRLQDWWVRLSATIGTFLIWFISGLAVSEFLSGFQPLNFTYSSIFGYISGFGYEFVGIALLFVAARHLEKGHIIKAVIALSGALFIAISSFFGQYLAFQHEAITNTLDIPTAALVGLPVDKNFILGARALIPTVIEFYLVFLVAEKKKDVSTAIAERRKVRIEISHLEDDENATQQINIARNAVTTVLEASTKAFK